MPHDGASAQANGRLDQWLAILDRYSVQFLILDRQRDDKLLRLVRSRHDWTVDFEDRDSVLFARTRLPDGMPSPFAKGLQTEAECHTLFAEGLPTEAEVPYFVRQRSPDRGGSRIES